MYRGKILGESGNAHAHVEPLAMSDKERLRKRLMIGESVNASRDHLLPERSSSISFIQTPSNSNQHPKYEKPSRDYHA